MFLGNWRKSHQGYAIPAEEMLSREMLARDRLTYSFIYPEKSSSGDGEKLTLLRQLTTLLGMAWA